MYCGPYRRRKADLPGPERRDTAGYRLRRAVRAERASDGDRARSPGLLFNPASIRDSSSLSFDDGSRVQERTCPEREMSGSTTGRSPTLMSATLTDRWCCTTTEVPGADWKPNCSIPRRRPTACASSALTGRASEALILRRTEPSSLGGGSSAARRLLRRRGVRRHRVVRGRALGSRGGGVPGPRSPCPRRVHRRWQLRNVRRELGRTLPE